MDNPGSLLLPGMTATVDFEVAKATDVFKISSAALRLQPTTAMLAKLPKHTRPDSAHRPRAGSPRPGAAGRDSAMARRAASFDSTSFGRLWYLDDRGRLAVVPVHTGISDGKVTQISGPPQLTAGLKVIVAVTSGKTSKTTSSSSSSTSPFQSQQQQRGPGGPPPGM